MNFLSGLNIQIIIHNAYIWSQRFFFQYLLSNWRNNTFIEKDFFNKIYQDVLREIDSTIVKYIVIWIVFLWRVESNHFDKVKNMSC